MGLLSHEGNLQNVFFFIKLLGKFNFERNLLKILFLGALGQPRAAKKADLAVQMKNNRAVSAKGQMCKTVGKL